jgi:hypothetical protein
LAIGQEGTMATRVTDTDDRFEQTRQKILYHLGEALEACAQPREFQVLIGPIVRLQEDVLTVTPGVWADSLHAKMKVNPWGPLLKRANWLTFAMVFIVLAFGAEYLRRAIQDIKEGLGKFGEFHLIDRAYATAGASAVDPTAFYIFQLVIAAMIPILGIGGFCALIFANSPEGRKGGKELLIGVTGFVLGAATRMI